MLGRCLLAMGLAALAGAGTLAAQSGPPASVPGVWLALRHDSAHVELVLGENPPYNRRLFRAIEAHVPRTAPPASCGMLCFFPVPDELAQTVFATLRPDAWSVAPPAALRRGDQYRILLGNGNTALATVDSMLAFTGDSFFIGALAAIAPAGLAAYRASTSPVFLAQVADIPLARRRDRPAMAAASPADADGVVAVLDQQLVNQIQSLRMSEPTPLPPGEQTRVQELLHQPARPSAVEVERVRLSSGAVRYYARAEWDVGGKATFALNAWLALQPRPHAIAIDERPPNAPFIIDHYAAPGAALRRQPELLNVVALAGGRTGLLMLSFGYEQSGYRLYVYDDSGPQRTSAYVGDGG